MEVLTHDAQYYRDNFSRRTSIIDEYKRNMLTSMRSLFPGVPEDRLESEIAKIMKEQYVPTDIRYLEQDTPGTVSIRDSTLLDYTNELNADILTPYGSTYVPVSERKSFFIDYIEGAQSERKVVKKEMLLAEATGDTELATIKNLRQMNIKININALSGVMLSNVAFRSAINYNSITSTARFNTMLAYSSVEMMLEANYYFHSEDKAINWVTNLLRVYPGDAKFTECLTKYEMSLPSVEVVSDFFSKQVRSYSKFNKTLVLKELLLTLTPLQVAFVYYAQNLKHIVQTNDRFRRYFDELFDIAHVTTVTGDVPKIDRLSDEIITTMTVVILADDIGVLSRRAIDEHHPDLARKIYSMYKHIEHQFEYLGLLFDVLISLPVVPSEIIYHKNIIRKTVLLSDTDSILFTTASWVKWYTSDIRVCDKANNMNAAIVALTFKALEHMFAYTSANMNVSVENMKTVALKNEFMYDVFMRTPISKHYAGYVKYREGVRLSPYKFDIKGKNFKGSDLCKTTTEYVNKFIREIFDDFLITYKLDPNALIRKVVAFEQRIKQSIDLGDVTFLSQNPIKLKKDYANPESSSYIYYELWTEVFDDPYPSINPPQKCKTLPVKPLSLKHTENLDLIKRLNEKLYTKLITFLTKYPKRVFTRVIIPMDIPIPTELRELANYRKVCLSNCYSLYLILKSFNVVIYPSSESSSILFSDIYPQLLEDENHG